MSSIILPRRFKEKPATIASIDKSILAPKSVYYPFTSGAPTVDQFNGTVGSFSGSCRANPYGIVTASGDYLTGNSVRPLFKGSTFTAVFEVTLNTLSATHSAIIGTSGDQFFKFEIWDNGGGYVAITAKPYIAGSYRDGPSVGFLSTIDNTVRVGLAFAWQQPYFKLYANVFSSGVITSGTSTAYGAPLDDRGGGLLFGKNHAGTQSFDGSIRYFLATEKYLSQDEIVRVFDDPWQIFKRQPQVLYFDVGGGGGTIVAPGAGALVASGSAPAIAQPRTVSPGAAAASAVGYAPAISQGTSVSPGVAAAVAQGHAPVISQPRTLSVGAAAIAATGYAPDISQGASVAPGAAAVVASGYAPTISQPRTVAAGSAAAVAAGYAPEVSQIATVRPGAGAAVVAGYAPTISQPRTVSPGVGAYDVLGYAPSISQSQLIAPASAAIVVLGHAPAVAQGGAVTVSPAPAAGVWLGYAPSIVTGINALLSAPRSGTYRNTSGATRSNLQTARRPKA